MNRTNVAKAPIYKCVWCNRTSPANYCSTSTCPGHGNSQFMLPNPAWEAKFFRNWRESARRQLG